MDLKPEILNMQRLCCLMSEMRIIRDIINGNMSHGANCVDNDIYPALNKPSNISDSEFGDYNLACYIDLRIKAEENCRYFTLEKLAEDLDSILSQLSKYIVYDVHNDPDIRAIVDSYQSKLDELSGRSFDEKYELGTKVSCDNNGFSLESTDGMSNRKPVDLNYDCE